MPYKEHSDRLKQSKKYYDENRVKHLFTMNEYYQNNKEKQLGAQLVRRRARRLLVLQRYSGSTIPFCSCCGERELMFLAIDHVEGGGNKHRKSIGGGALTVEWIIKNNFPVGFQILCHNCNLAKGFYGSCPHSIISDLDI